MLLEWEDNSRGVGPEGREGTIVLAAPSPSRLRRLQKISNVAFYLPTEMTILSTKGRRIE